MMHHLRSQVMVTGKIIKETPRDRYMDTALLESQQKYNLSKPHMMHHLRSQVMVTGKIIKETPRDRYMDTALLESQQKYNLSKPHMMHHLRSQVMVTSKIIKETPSILIRLKTNKLKKFLHVIYMLHISLKKKESILHQLRFPITLKDKLHVVYYGCKTKKKTSPQKVASKFLTQRNNLAS